MLLSVMGTRTGADLDGDEFANEKLEQAVGITQHHDAITGTEQQHVANDYHKRLDRAQYLASIVTFYENGGSQSYCKYSNIRYL